MLMLSPALALIFPLFLLLLFVLRLASSLRRILLASSRHFGHRHCCPLQFWTNCCPCLHCPSSKGGGGASKVARRRRRTRTSKRAEVDSVIEGLNALFGRGPAVTQDITAAQASCHAHLLKVCCRIDCSSFLTRPREAVRLLLGSALHDYGVDASSTVRPYNVSKLSLPAQLKPVELASIS